MNLISNSFLNNTCNKAKRCSCNCNCAAAQSQKMTPEPFELHSGSLRRNDLISNTAKYADLLNKKKKYNTQKDIIKAQAGSTMNILDNADYDRENSQSTGSSLSEVMFPQKDPKQIEKNINLKKNENVSHIVAVKNENSDNTSNNGLLCYRKWWERVETEIQVNGKLITGVPIFIEENTLRVINNDHSYFIPLSKVDYIRTDDGLCSSDLHEDKIT